MRNRKLAWRPAVQRRTPNSIDYIVYAVSQTSGRQHKTITCPGTAYMSVYRQNLCASVRLLLVTAVS